MAWQPLEKGENNYDVLVIGAGISGINFGYRLQERNPHLSYCILEARHELGGTWSLFNYPGQSYAVIFASMLLLTLYQEFDPTLTCTHSASRGDHGRPPRLLHRVL